MAGGCGPSAEALPLLLPGSNATSGARSSLSGAPGMSAASLPPPLCTATDGACTAEPRSGLAVVGVAAVEAPEACQTVRWTPGEY
jgi:hypothetical protein